MKVKTALWFLLPFSLREFVDDIEKVLFFKFGTYFVAPGPLTVGKAQTGFSKESFVIVNQPGRSD